ncbi:MAG: phage minor head protein, partial [Saprospiraceae bacterium]
EAFEELESHLLEGFEGGWDSTDIDYNSEDIIRKRMMELNVTRFSAAATMKMAMELNAAKAAASGWSDFKMAAEKLLGTYNANYLRTEYNLAVATAQNASNYIRLKKDMEILPYWKYQTVGDGRVRSSHQALDGKVLKADDPIWDNIYPPNGYGCRCEVIALSDLDGEELSDSDDALNSLGEEYGKMQERGFDKNRGELAIVYADAQLYMDAAFGSRLSYKQYGLDSFENLQKTKADIPSTSRTYEETKEWFDDKATDGEIMTDGWDNIPVRLGFDALRKHRYKHKHEGRFNYMEAVLDTIRNPDEVYLKKLGENRFEMNLFGIYKDEVLMIPVSTDDFEFNIKTWFLLKKEKDSRRTGILLRG